MSTTRVIRHSLKTMARYRVRTGFMMLGSVVGVAALTLVISAGQAAERKVLTTIGQIFGESSIIIIDGAGRMMGSPRGPAAHLKLDDVEALAKELPDIDDWDAQEALPNASVRHGDATNTARVLGASERTERVWARKASQGEYFDSATVRSADRVALIGETVARELFRDEDPLGSDIRIGSVVFRVIGVLERWGTDAHGMDRDNEVVVPISTLMRRLTNVDTIDAAKLLIRDPSRSEELKHEIRRILRERHALAVNEPDDFTIHTATGVRRMVQQIQKVLFLYLPLVAGVSLLAGGLVSAALMLVSVNERTGEIGLKRALGAGTGDIRLQFLIETVATTLAGGGLGIALGYMGARLAATRLHLGGVEIWSAVLLGITASMVVGLVAGLVPAMRAARLRPADALR